MSAVLSFVGLALVLACLVGMLTQARQINSFNRDVRKMFYYYIGMAISVCFTAVVVMEFIYLVGGLLLVGAGITLYIWKLKPQFKELKELDVINKYIKENKDEFKADFAKLDGLITQRLELDLSISRQTQEIQDKA